VYLNMLVTPSQAARRSRRGARQARAEHNAQRLALASSRAHTCSAAFVRSDAVLSPARAGAAECSVGSQPPIYVAPTDHLQPAAEVALPAPAADSHAHDMKPAGAQSPADIQEAGSQEAAEQPLDSSPSAQLHKCVPQWRIIRPQRCKYRHMDHMAADPYDEVEVGA
jgi:hypothetical protein